MSLSEYEGRVALVTGAGRGIGRAIAVRLAAMGFDTVVHYGNSADSAGKTADEITSGGGRACAIHADMSRVDNIDSMFASVQERFGRLDVLVNNAGRVLRTPLETITEDELDAVMAVNIKGTVIAAREAIKLMPSGGCIVNISSSRVHFPSAGTSAYAASKSAVETLTAVWAQELGNKGITVNAVAPGPAVPGMFERVPAPMQRMARDSSPFGRIGTAEEVAGVVAFLCSNDARWITGQTILVNGGGKL